MSEWEQVPLETLLSASVSYGIVQPGVGQEVGVPIVRVKDVRNGKVDVSDPLLVSSDIESKYVRTRLRGGELLLTLVGSTGQVAVVPPQLAGWNVARAIGVLRPLPIVSPRWLQYFLESEGAQQYIHERLNTTVQATLNLKDVRLLPVALPSQEERAAIVEVLGALDDKIAFSGRIATTADELSGELFRYSMLARPDRFIELALSGAAEFINGRAFTKGATGTGRMVVRIADINSGPGSSTVYNDIEVPDMHLARPGDVLFAWSGSLIVTRWFRPEAIINQHIFKCVPKNGYPHWLVSQLVQRKIDGFRAIAADKATTMGHIQRKHLDEPVSVPVTEELALLDSQIGPLWDRALLAERESLALATLRDTLLPQLMSGRLRVKDAEKIVEDAT
ncbi:restriction endonuclease subunit S [Streptomyces sp. NPDC058464]|uniref:restriction endonuclease subunit S n=1 Tax=Streptomyces sp. NPDC058464 TaxID=3346511 RepID=UPI0036619E41